MLFFLSLIYTNPFNDSTIDLSSTEESQSNIHNLSIKNSSYTELDEKLSSYVKKNLLSDLKNETEPLISKQGQCINTYFEMVAHKLLWPFGQYLYKLSDFFNQNQNLPDKTLKLLYSITTILNECVPKLQEIFEKEKNALITKAEKSLSEDTEDFAKKLTVSISQNDNIKLSLANPFYIINLFIAANMSLESAYKTLISQSILSLKEKLLDFGSEEIKNEAKLMELVEIVFEIISSLDIDVDTVIEEFYGKLIQESLRINYDINNVFVNNVIECLVHKRNEIVGVISGGSANGYPVANPLV